MIYLYGAGGHSKVILDILHQQSRPVQAILDDQPSPDRPKIYGVPVRQASLALAAIAPSQGEWIVAIGNNRIRQKIAMNLSRQGYRFTTAIHPAARIGLGVTLGPGSVVMANAVINPDTRVGQHSIVNTGATIDHDCVLGDYCHVAPGCSVCGQVQIGSGVLLGVGSCVCPGVEIGAATTCGAGSVVIRSLPPNCLAYGCPARVVGYQEED